MNTIRYVGSPGAAVLAGLLILTARLMATTFLIFGLADFIPLFGFDLWFRRVEPILDA